MRALSWYIRRHPRDDRRTEAHLSTDAQVLAEPKGFVYLSIYPRHARDFASMAYPGKEVKVYGVTVPIRELMADKDQLRNQRHFAGREIPKDNLTFSLAFGHGARLKRRVWPYEIEEFIP